VLVNDVFRDNAVFYVKSELIFSSTKYILRRLSAFLLVVRFCELIFVHKAYFESGTFIGPSAKPTRARALGTDQLNAHALAS
jgi:hypothetical protein